MRIGNPAQLDSTLLFLVSPSSDFVTGTCVRVDDVQDAPAPGERFILTEMQEGTRPLGADSRRLKPDMIVLKLYNCRSWVAAKRDLT
ncbi:hypothetical protein I3J27_33630 [Bradyrhizobium xenonodulans]|uniref:Uncharacterized protein n=1 Tax=Bradyrhizobium xenonodulans TaxID=2736875 RepID=A0ABY7MLT0_9BRAD|nr:hypothetical protein [Bradyrhizobium xenonodulans]WBL77875.1 hypothetical protein I3J27_33630 [Bradyrhizobium xenonodulans]